MHVCSKSFFVQQKHYFDAVHLIGIADMVRYTPGVIERAIAYSTKYHVGTRTIHRLWWRDTHTQWTLLSYRYLPAATRTIQWAILTSPHHQAPDTSALFYSQPKPRALLLDLYSTVVSIDSAICRPSECTVGTVCKQGLWLTVTTRPPLPHTRPPHFYLDHPTFFLDQRFKVTWA